LLVIGHGQGNNFGLAELRAVAGIVAVPAVRDVTPVLGESNFGPDSNWLNLERSQVPQPFLQSARFCVLSEVCAGKPIDHRLAQTIGAKNTWRSYFSYFAAIPPLREKKYSSRR